MARRKGKGKSQRRIKEWHGRYHAGEDADANAHRGRKHTQRAVKLPTSRLEAPDENLDGLPKVQGLVVGVYRNGATVRIDRREIFCAIVKTYRAAETASALAVGDVVTVALIHERHADGQMEIDKHRADGMILSRQLRQTALSRPKPVSGKRVDPYRSETFEQVIAANMDVLLIVAATRQPALRPRLIERFLIVAERGGLEPLVVINKIDLGPPAPKAIANIHALGVETPHCSALTGEGLDGLRQRLAGRRNVLAGASGVGKSALVNALIPGAGAATRTIRLKDNRGRHTTAAAAVYDLPKPVGPAPAALPAPELPVGVGPGGIIVDTPGVRELGLTIDPQELPWYFPEFEPFVPACRFNDCTHTHEPECGILAAVEAGQVPLRRYESYLRIYDSLE